MSVVSNPDEYKAPGEVVKFRIGPSRVFGKGFETEVKSGDTVFDFLEVLGHRRRVSILNEVVDTLDRANNPDTGLYEDVTLKTRNEIKFEKEILDANGNPDYSQTSPLIVGNIIDGVPPPFPDVGDHFLIRGSDFIPFSEGNVVEWSGTDWVLITSDTFGRPISFKFSKQIGNSITLDDELFYLVESIVFTIDLNDKVSGRDVGLYRIGVVGVYNIVSASLSANTFIIDDDYSRLFITNVTFDVLGSSGSNNTNYIVISSSVVSVTETTSRTIIVVASVINNTGAIGTITVSDADYEVGKVLELTLDDEFVPWVPPITITSPSEFGPIMVSRIIPLNEQVEVYVRDKDKNIRDDNDITFSTPSLVQYDSKIDRLSHDLGGLYQQDITLTVNFGALKPGDSIWIRYKQFIHTDSARDRSDRTLFRSSDDVSDLELLIDFSPSGGTKAPYKYNNIQLNSHLTAYVLGGNTFIIYVGTINKAGILKFKRHNSGISTGVHSGEMTVIKFNETDARFLRVNLFDLQNTNVFAVTIGITDPALKTFSSDGDTVIDIADYISLVITPFYHDKSTEGSKITSIIKGDDVYVNQLVANSIGRVYVPNFSNINEVFAKDYKLLYLQISYEGGTESGMVYKGILPNKNADLSKLISISDEDVPSGSEAMDIQADLLIDRTDGNDIEVFTRFKNITNDIPVIFEISILSAGSIEDLPDNPGTFTAITPNVFDNRKPSCDYLENGNIVLVFEEIEASRTNIVIKRLSHNGNDNLMDESPGKTESVVSLSGHATNPKCKTLTDGNGKIVVVFESDIPISGEPVGIYYSTFTSDLVNITRKFVLNQVDSPNSFDPKVAVFKTGGFVITNKTSSNRIDIKTIDVVGIDNDAVLLNVDTSKKYDLVSLDDNTFLIVYTTDSTHAINPNSLKIVQYDANLTNIGLNDFNETTGVIFSPITGLTGNIINASPVMTNIATATLIVGMNVSGSGIPALTRILTIDSGTLLTLNKNSTATASGVTLVFSNFLNPTITGFDKNKVVIVYETSIAGIITIAFRIFKKSGKDLTTSGSAVGLSTGTFPQVIEAPSNGKGNFYVLFKVGNDYFFKFVEIFVIESAEQLFPLYKEVFTDRVTVFRGRSGGTLTTLTLYADFEVIRDGIELQINIKTVPDDTFIVIRDLTDTITLSSGGTLSNEAIASYLPMGDDIAFLFEVTGSPITIGVKIFNYNNFKLIKTNLIDPDDEGILMVPGDGSLGEYVIDKRSGKIIFIQRDSNGDSIVSTFPGINFELKAKYVFKVKRESESDPQKFITFLGSKELGKFIGYSGIRVYPIHLFADYLPNNEIEVFRFPNNPESESISSETAGGSIKLLSNNRKKDKIGDSKFVTEYSGPKIDKNFRDSLQNFHDNNEELILVDDKRKVTVGFIAPNSLKTQRRETSAEEKKLETGSYSYSFIFQES